VSILDIVCAPEDRFDGSYQWVVTFLSKMVDGDGLVDGQHTIDKHAEFQVIPRVVYGEISPDFDIDKVFLSVFGAYKD
jgi:hypothetical protein